MADEPTKPVISEQPESTEVKTQDDSSKIMGVSIRGIIALIIVITVCVMSGFKIGIAEPLYTLSGMVLAFYFGHQTGASTKKP